MKIEDENYNLNIRWALDSDLERVNNFYNIFYKSNRTLNQINWIFKNNILEIDHLLLALAEINGEIVGTQALIPIPFKEGNFSFFTAKSEETLVARKAFKYNTFFKLYDFIIKDVEKYDFKFIWGFTPKVKAFKRIGFISPMKTNIWIKFIRNEALGLYLNNRKNYFKHLDLLSFLLVVSQNVFTIFQKFFLKFKFKNSSCYVFEEYNYSEDNFFKYIKNINKNSPVFKYLNIDKNEKYLKWRLNENPFCKPLNIFLFDYSLSTEPLGYIIFGMNEDRKAAIIDFAIKNDTNDVSVGFYILQELERRVFNMGAHSIIAWDPNIIESKLRKILIKRGYLRLRKGSDFVYRNISSTSKYDWENIKRKIIISRLMNLGSVY